MPSVTATVTANYGPGSTATAKVITGIQAIVLDVARNMLRLHTQNPDPSSPAIEFELEDVDTFTVTVGAVTWTLTVDQA